MSVLTEKAMYDLKWNYNYNLNRYYKGCDYISQKSKDAEKFYTVLFEILDNINLLLAEIIKEQDVTEDEILYGFKISETKGDDNK